MSGPPSVKAGQVSSACPLAMDSRWRTFMPVTYGGGAHRHLVGEKAHHRVVDRQEPLGLGDADGRGREALGQRVQQVDAIGPVRRPPALGHDVAVAHQHERVQVQAGRPRRRPGRRAPRRRRRPGRTGPSGAEERAVTRSRVMPSRRSRRASLAACPSGLVARAGRAVIIMSVPTACSCRGRRGQQGKESTR